MIRSIVSVTLNVDRVLGTSVGAGSIPACGDVAPGCVAPVMGEGGTGLIVSVGGGIAPSCVSIAPHDVGESGDRFRRSNRGGGMVPGESGVVQGVLAGAEMPIGPGECSNGDR